MDDPYPRDEAMPRTEAAGRLLVIAMRHSNGTVRRYARAAAEVAAQHGAARARGWLLGIWSDVQIVTVRR